MDLGRLWRRRCRSERHKLSVKQRQGTVSSTATAIGGVGGKRYLGSGAAASGPASAQSTAKNAGGSVTTSANSPDAFGSAGA